MLMFLYDFLPIALFFIAFKLHGIYTATIVGIVATILQVLITRIWKGSFDKKQLITLLVFALFGGMTLYFHNPIFIKWKPTVIFGIFGIVLLATQFISSKPLIQRLLEHSLEKQSAHTVPSPVWKKLNLAWGIFFIFLGIINLYVAYTFSTEVWVNFKLYGILGLLMLFSIIQAIFLSHYLSDSK